MILRILLLVYAGDPDQALNSMHVCVYACMRFRSQDGSGNRSYSAGEKESSNGDGNQHFISLL